MVLSSTTRTLSLHETTMMTIDEESRVAREILLLRWRDLRDPIFMDPLEFEPYTYTVEQTLRERFKDTGLQVIVKMASIELTPEKPGFPTGGWHVSLYSSHRRESREIVALAR